MTESVTEPQPETTVVEWGSGRRGRLGRLVPSWWRPRFGWLFAGLGALAIFGSLVGEWQTVVMVVERGSVLGGAFTDDQEITFGLADIGVWGTGWLVGAMVLATCLGLVVFGAPSVQRQVRVAGLVAAGALLGMLVAASIDLMRDDPFNSGLFLPDPRRPEYGLGPGLYAAYAAVALVAAALWSIRPAPVEVTPAAPAGPPEPEPGRPVQPGPGTRSYAGPRDLTVAPAEPAALPGDRQGWH